jgi:hypothetical protein
MTKCENCQENFDTMNIRNTICDNCRRIDRNLRRSAARAERSRQKRANTDSINCEVCDYQIYFFPDHQSGRPDLNKCLRCQGMILEQCITCKTDFWCRRRQWYNYNECNWCETDRKLKHERMKIAFQNGTPDPDLINNRYLISVTYTEILRDSPASSPSMESIYLINEDESQYIVREYPLHKDIEIGDDNDVNICQKYMSLYSLESYEMVSAETKSTLMCKYAGKR